MNNSSFLKGTLILTIATAVSKILGFIYIIPFTALVGIQGYILFEYAYKPYAIILSVATMGIPLAVSKFVSKYRELGDHETVRRLFKSGIFFMSATGILTFLALYLSAPSIATILIDENATNGNTLSDVTHVIKMVSFALLVVPPMAMMRGYFQGHQYMTPTAVSQVIEQLIRIVVILFGSLVVLRVMNLSIAHAVGVSTFAATLGAIAGFIALFFYWKKLTPPVLDTPPPAAMPLSKMYKELLGYAIPIAFVGLAVPFYQTLDTFMINRSLMSIGYSQGDAETVNSVLALVQKIILIPVSLATAFGLTLIPVITRSFVANDWHQLHRNIRDTFKVIFFLTLPALAGLVVLGKPSFVTLFGERQAELGSYLLAVHAPTAILFALFIVTSAMLQGINRHKLAAVSLLIGFAAKVLLNYPFIIWFEELGTILTSNIGFAISLAINFWLLKRHIQFPFRQTLNALLPSLILVVIMGVVVFGVDQLVAQFAFSHLSLYPQSILRLLIGATVGAIVYAVASIRTQVIFDILGNKVSFLNRFKK